ncbi:MAG: hypothetical protein MZU97_07190 [Bacillus subtilis]|nr:hypothetical protein [Bacillus subtilis]
MRLVVCTVPFIALALTPHLSVAGTDPFPAIPGWRLTGPPIVYTPDNLWDFIDGAAESYLAYSFVDLQVGEYVSPESVAVRVELYRHADPDNAFGIYATERAPGYSFLKVGAQGYEAEGILNFLTGRYYVKLSTHQREIRLRSRPSNRCGEHRRASCGGFRTSGQADPAAS